MEKIKLKTYLVKGMQGHRGKHNYNKKINLLKFYIKTCTLSVYKIAVRQIIGHEYKLVNLYEKLLVLRGKRAFFSII